MIEIYDIETLKNMFLYIGLNIDSKELSIFIIHKDRNDIKALIKHLKQLKGQIGFNNLSFDAQITEWILDNMSEEDGSNGEELANAIYNRAQSTIETTFNGGWADIPEWHMSIPQLDLFKIWHFDNRNKMTGLKYVEFSIDFPDIREMPIHHNQEVSPDQFQEIIDYCKNDVYATYEFYKITKGETDHPLYKGIDRIQLRKDIKKELGINCTNYNDVKIGDEINKVMYMRTNGITKYEIPKPSLHIKPFKFSDCYPSYTYFTTDKFKNFIDSVGRYEVNLEKKQEFKLEYNGTTYTMMKGGLHSEDPARIIKPIENQILRDADCCSMYPNAIRKRKLYPKHLGESWLNGYTDIIQKRLDAKKKYKETKEPKYQAIQEAFKLSLNGGSFGKTGEEGSWQYDPFVSMSVTIGCQIDLLMLIEMLEVKGIHILSANTDGLVCLFDKSQEETYYDICKQWGIIVGNDTLGQLEYTDYKLLAQTSVNDYITIKTNDEVKLKGDFCIDFEIHKNKSARIVPMAIKEYFINNTNIEKTISEHNNIMDFCIGVKAVKGNKFVHFDSKTLKEEELQKVNRFYISNNGKNLLKRLPKLENKTQSNQIDIFGNIDTGIREQEVEASWLSTIYNSHICKLIKEYDICYDYYIKRTNKILNQLK